MLDDRLDIEPTTKMTHLDTVQLSTAEISGR
jgi:hypothetical protein